MMDKTGRKRGRHGRACANKELFKFPKPCYVILDPKGEYFRDFTGSTPAALHSFTDSFANARKLYDPEEAKGVKEKVLEWLIENDGIDEVPRDYLRVAEVACRTITDGKDTRVEGADGPGRMAKITLDESKDENADGRRSAMGRYCVNVEAVHGTIVDVRARDEDDAERRVRKMWANGKIALENLSFREMRIVNAACLGK